MNKTGPALIKPDPNKKSHVVVGLESGAKKIKVNRAMFWVSKSGETGEKVAEWFCNRTEEEPLHKHDINSPCFWVEFDKGSPFESEKFTSDANGYAYSDKVRDDVKPDTAKRYHYYVHMNDKPPLDPTGGVEP
jgi:hypothetical protein